MVTLEVKQEVNFEYFGDYDVDLHHVGRRRERMRPSCRSLALGQHPGEAAFPERRQLVADLGPRGGGGSGRQRGRCGRVEPVVVGRRQADTGEVDECKIDALSGGDRQPPRAVSGTAAAACRDAA